MSKLVPLKVNTGETVMVADIMVNSLNKYLAIFPEYEFIKRVYLFGSTLEERCNEDSDIDLFVVFEGARDNFYEFLFELRQKCDVAIFDDILGGTAEQFYTKNPHGGLEQIRQKGVIIYDS